MNLDINLVITTSVLTANALLCYLNTRQLLSIARKVNTQEDVEIRRYSILGKRPDVYVPEYRIVGEEPDTERCAVVTRCERGHTATTQRLYPDSGDM